MLDKFSFIVHFIIYNNLELAVKLILINFGGQFIYYVSLSGLYFNDFDIYLEKNANLNRNLDFWTKINVYFSSATLHCANIIIELHFYLKSILNKKSIKKNCKSSIKIS